MFLVLNFERYLRALSTFILETNEKSEKTAVTRRLLVLAVERVTIATVSSE